MSQTKVLYVNDSQGLIAMLQFLSDHERNDLVIIGASTKDEIIKIMDDNPDIKVIIISGHSRKLITTINEKKGKLKSQPIILGTSINHDHLKYLDEHGCTLVFSEGNEILDHIPHHHPDV
jgi:hypothetical protein